MDDATVLAIVVAVVAEYGRLDLDACIVRLAAERANRSRLLHFPLRHIRESCPSGAA